MSSQRVSREERMYEVYRFHQRSTTQPCELIDAKTAIYWLDCGFATRVGRWRLRLVKESPLKLRDLSARMGPSVMFAAACGSRHHQSLVEAWAQ
jgi:3-deoxy-D-arabino-heptulosonate 7-phosphate (DAHP) synthase class II